MDASRRVARQPTHESASRQEAVAPAPGGLRQPSPSRPRLPARRTSTDTPTEAAPARAVAFGRLPDARPVPATRRRPLRRRRRRTRRPRPAGSATTRSSSRLDARDGAPHFVFYEGPPTANGKPGIHHVMARTVKDLFCRYKTMQGFRVDRKAGWDTHGLPVEIEVEKQLGLKGRDAVEAYGLAKFNAACRASVLTYKDLWDALTVRMGYWVDLEHPYVTFETDYMESVWNLLKRISERTDAERRVAPHARPPHPVVQPRQRDGPLEPRGRASATRRSRTRPAPSASPSRASPARPSSRGRRRRGRSPPTPRSPSTRSTTYAKVRLDDTTAGAHRARLDRRGARLAASRARARSSSAGPAPTSSGRSTCRPTHSARDDAASSSASPTRSPTRTAPATSGASSPPTTSRPRTARASSTPPRPSAWTTGRRARRRACPTFNPINPTARSRTASRSSAGWTSRRPTARSSATSRSAACSTARTRTSTTTRTTGAAARRSCSTRSSSWFARTTAVKDRMVELNKTVNWQPEGIGTGRFGQWLENNVDWALSRMRFWGTPLPIWVSDRDEDRLRGHRLRRRAAGEGRRRRSRPRRSTPRRASSTSTAPTSTPSRGPIPPAAPCAASRTSSTSGSTRARCRGRSGTPRSRTPTASRANVPADFIAEGVDQTRGWFYTLHAIAALVDDRVAYKNVVVNGLVLDEKGQKMSKSVGNTVDPFEAIEAHGADAVRWTMMSA